MQSDEFQRQRPVSLRAPRRRVHPCAKASLACGLIFVCPLTSLAAVALGVVALRALRVGAATGGMRVARCGLVLGLLFTTLHGLLAYQVWRVAAALEQGPQAALTVGLAGNSEGFRRHFHGPGRDGTDDDVLAFTSALRQRYGGFVSGRPVEAQGLRFQPPGRVARAYTLEFTEHRVRADAGFTVADPDRRAWLVNKLEFIRIVDQDLGDLCYPRGSSGAGDVATGAAGVAAASSARNE
jgi:hypothetical protein